VDVATAIWGGIVGTIALVAVYGGFLATRLTRLDLVRFQGHAISQEHSSLVYVYGAIFQLVLAAAFSVGYYYIFKQIDSATYAGWGALLGLAQGVLVALLLPLLGQADRGVREGAIKAPGIGGVRYGRLTPLALLAANLVFGVWVGLFVLPA
jgi:hypothetical protein